MVEQERDREVAHLDQELGTALRTQEVDRLHRAEHLGLALSVAVLAGVAPVVGQRRALRLSVVDQRRAERDTLVEVGVQALEADAELRGPSEAFQLRLRERRLVGPREHEHEPLVVRGDADACVGRDLREEILRRVRGAGDVVEGLVRAVEARQEVGAPPLHHVRHDLGGQLPPELGVPADHPQPLRDVSPRLVGGRDERARHEAAVANVAGQDRIDDLGLELPLRARRRRLRQRGRCHLIPLDHAIRIGGNAPSGAYASVTRSRPSEFTSQLVLIVD